ncbi:glycosyltransferase family 2 protein [Ekhidna sp.]|uniref:glycosyltransferase family 2 protein n=1 Tax=Ekhidna sp. TaxID=2608089 RepID=UPI0032980898
MKRRKLYRVNDLIGSPMAPSVSLIAPAYNEGLTIVENIRSMISLEYNNYDVIVVNDGSKDDTLRNVIEAFDLVEVPFHVNAKVNTKEIVSVYKSLNRSFKKLTIVNKINGGKADALNAGINVSSSRLVACIDVDCILENDALQRMVKPFMEDSSVIASGGVVRIANSCEVEHGKLLKVNLPTNSLARFQVLEYLRAFLLSRMAWARLNGLLLISGAFGMFDRKLILMAGGYSTDTVGEDMELVVRMRSMMTRAKRKFKVTMIPDPLCWTEAPSTNEILAKQRNRWARGTYEVLKKHTYLFLNTKYKITGLFGYPFWFFFEWMAPLLEFSGLVYFVFLLLTGSVSWTYFLTLLVMFYCFSIFISSFTLYAEEISFYKYGQVKDQLKLLFAALLEPFVYHPKVVWSSVKGNLDIMKGVKSWGEMTRSGFKKVKIAKPNTQ